MVEPLPPLDLPLDVLAQAFSGWPHLAGLWDKLRTGAGALTPAESIQVHLAECRVLETHSQRSDALARLAAVRAWARQVPDVEGEAGALALMANAHRGLGHVEQALALATEAFQLAGRSPAGVIALTARATTIGPMGRVDEAETDFLLAADISQEVGFTLGRILALEGLAQIVYAIRGLSSLALARSDDALRLRREAGLPGYWGLWFKANLAFLRADRELTRTTLAAMAAEPLPQLAAGWHAYLSALFCAVDEADPVRARQWLERARQACDAFGNPALDVLVRLAASVCERFADQPAAALAWASDAVDFAQRTSQTYRLTYALMERAHCAWDLGDLPSAAADFLAALDQADRDHDLYGAARAAFLLAALRRAQDHPDANTAWLDAARRLLQGDVVFVLERERDVSYPLLAALTRSRHPAVRESAEALWTRLSRLPPQPLEISGLGRFEVRQGRRVLSERDWSRRKAGELFRFLLLQPGRTAPREVVLEALWPEHAAAGAHTQLHQATSALRRLLEPDLPDKFPSRYLEVGAQRLAVKLPPGSTLDFEAFDHDLEAALSRPNLASRAAALEQVLARYGPLFPADLYTDWSALARERLASRCLSGLLALAQAALETGQPALALAAAQRALAADPWREDAVLLGMRASLAQGERPGAVRLFRDLELRLRADLDLAPRDDLQALAASLRDPRP